MFLNIRVKRNNKGKEIGDEQLEKVAGGNPETDLDYSTYDIENVHNPDCGKKSSKIRLKVEGKVTPKKLAITDKCQYESET